MTWLAPLAFLGLAAIAVPILVHLFGRPRARLVRFPTLRFIELTRDAPRRRAVPTDWLLLAIRIGVIAAAVLALAQPTWPGLGVPPAEAGIARVILVDTSASMQGVGGAGALGAARAEAARLSGEGGEVLVAETAWPSLGMAGASEWLVPRHGMREVVVISDFQPGVVVPGDTAQLAPGIGLRLVRVERAPVAGVDSGPRAIRVGESVRAEWPVAARAARDAIEIVAGEPDREAAAAVTNVMGGAGARVDRRVSIVLAGAPMRDSVVARLQPPTRPWQGDVLASLARDEGVSRLRASGPPDRVAGAVPLGAGPAAIAGVVNDSSLAILPAAGADALAWAVLADAAARALGARAALSEQDPAVLPDESVRAMERPAVDAGPQPTGGTASRWLWVVAVALLALEWLVRRRQATPVLAVPAGRSDERAA